jgi:DNA-binding protein H-NS
MSFGSGCHLNRIRRCAVGLLLTPLIEAILEVIVNNKDLTKLTAEELWTLHEEVRAMLSSRLEAEIHKLQRRLGEIKGRDEVPGKGTKARRRPYPKVYPKYRNPEQPFETWSGRGVQPRWMRAQLRTGKQFDDLLISRAH